MINEQVEAAFKKRETPKDNSLVLLECPDCHTKLSGVPKYLDHRVNEFLGPLTEKVDGMKTPTGENLVLECKDGFCKMIEEHVEATYNVTKKGEEQQEEAGLFSVDDEAEEED